MASLVRLTALALARAMMAGPPTANGLAARMRACLGTHAAWCADTAARCAAMPGERWRRLTVRSLADLIERDAGFVQAWQTAAERPYPRRYLLHVAHVMQPLPVQGAPTSPALANLCAFRLDLRLDGLAFALGATYTRYADDLVLSGPAHLRTAFARIERHVMRIAMEEGFSLNPRKTRCLGAGRRQQVCGIVVNAHPNVPRDTFDRLKAILHACVHQGPAGQNREGHADWRAHLRGRVAWVTQLNAAKGARLERLFQRIDWAT